MTKTELFEIMFKAMIEMLELTKERLEKATNEEDKKVYREIIRKTVETLEKTDYKGIKL